MAMEASRWSLLPLPAEPLPWRKCHASASPKNRVAVFLLGAGEIGATAKQMADALDLTERQVIDACKVLRIERRIVCARSVPPAAHVGGRPLRVYVWRRFR